jgi:biotin carboxyl carrier protein
MSLYSVTAGTQGTVLSIGVSLGAQVKVAEVVIQIEIMKMEIPVEVPVAGRVASIHVSPGEFVAQGQLLLMIDTDSGRAL